jgi:hypothetical protein
MVIARKWSARFVTNPSNNLQWYSGFLTTTAEMISFRDDKK